jgi:para-aminobenzoate synthetase component 1
MLTEIFEVNNLYQLKQQLLTWANRFGSCSFLDNNQYQSEWQMQECLVAAGARDEFRISLQDPLPGIQDFISRNKGEWIFGHFGYDFKNWLGGNTGLPKNKTGFTPSYLFVPQYLVELKGQNAIVHSFLEDPRLVWQEILAIHLEENETATVADLQPAISKQEYLDIIDQLKNHIHRGDCYEINFCQEFSSTTSQIEPARVYHALTGISPNPFSCFYKINQSFLVCASPERFLAKKGHTIFSQPIKGTASRNTRDQQEDQQKIDSLRESPKERSENVMVVDLVRNDLSQVCSEGTVKVEELFGIYTYPQVHHLVSTISGKLKEGISFVEILQACFPMGSMTGAPKKKVMELIDVYEKDNRGLFSGAVGYFAPSGDFDFNVVIRSLFYNAATHYLSYWVGSGITWYSNPEEEYEECLLKAAAIKKVLQ